MMGGRMRWSIAAGTLLALSIVSMSFFDLSAIQGIGSAFASMTTLPPITSDSQGDIYDDYLEPCYGCTPTEDDFEMLTTFELFAKYPELSGDPIGNQTTENQSDVTPLLPQEDDEDEESTINERTTESRTELFDEDDDDDRQSQEDAERFDDDEENDRSDRDLSESDDVEDEDEQDSSVVEEECDSSYPNVCIPSAPPDLDCGDISEERFEVRGSDPHRFDGDDDGVGCED